jgi:heme/copper-type cytochrome/quinol oxidase subunit 2
MTDLLWPIILTANAAVIILLGIIFVWKTYKDRKEGLNIQDERTAKINGKAAIGAFWISYAYMLSILLWIIFVNEFMALPEFEIGWTVISIMLVSTVSYVSLRWYHNKKGEAL